MDEFCRCPAGEYAIATELFVINDSRSWPHRALPRPDARSTPVGHPLYSAPPQRCFTSAIKISRALVRAPYLAFLHSLFFLRTPHWTWKSLVFNPVDRREPRPIHSRARYRAGIYVGRQSCENLLLILWYVCERALSKDRNSIFQRKCSMMMSLHRGTVAHGKNFWVKITIELPATER